MTEQSKYDVTQAVAYVGQKVKSYNGSVYAVIFMLWNGHGTEKDSKIKYVKLLNLKTEKTVRVAYDQFIKQLNENKISLSSFEFTKDVGVINEPHFNQ